MPVKFCRILLFTLSTLSAQLIPAGRPIPRTQKLPVVLVNGYEYNCPGATFSHTFGIADQVLQTNGQASVFFNYCDVPGLPTIEELGAAFGAFLGRLRYEDGGTVDTVDVVVHSMGGLIVRSYLSGKQNTPGVFNPPAVTHVRKILFFGTPHFGTGLTMGLPLTPELDELSSGSRFLFDLATWNQNADDLRGADAIAVIGNGGTGLATTDGFDDGIVALTAASLGFLQPGRTRVLPKCHVDGGGLLTFALLCPSIGLGVAHIHSATEDSARIMTSFLNGTNDWKSIGVAAEQNPLLASNGGLYVSMRSADDATLRPESVIAGALGRTKQLNIASGNVAYTDMFAAGPVTLTAKSGAVQVSQNITLPATAGDPVIVKPGPLIAHVIPAASVVFPLTVAPGSIISIYGKSFDGAQVFVGTTPLYLYYGAADQINAVLPDNISGLIRLTVQSASGKNTVNVMIEPAVPSVFNLNGAAYTANGSRPLRAGDYLVFVLTGLGATTPIGGLDYARQQPSVTIAGKDCRVTYAGRAPGYPGLDQINCVVPAGLTPDSAAPLIVTSGARMSNTTTVPVQ